MFSLFRKITAFPIVVRIQKLLTVLSQKRVTTLAGTLAFFLLLSAVPLAFVLTLVLNWLQLSFDVTSLFNFPTEVGAVLHQIFAAAQQASQGLTLVFVLTTLYTATNFFYHIRISGELIYGEKHKRAGWLIRLSSFIILFLILACAIVCIVLFVFSSKLFLYILPQMAVGVVKYIVLLGILFVTLFIINLYACPYRLKFQNALPGTAFTTIYWVLFTMGFSIYVNYFGRYDRLYGAFTILIITLVWVYFLMMGLAAGFVFNDLWMRRKKSNEAHKKELVLSQKK